MKPRIGITCRYQIRLNQAEIEVPEISIDARFSDLIFAAGGIPVFIPPTDQPACLMPILESLDGIVLSGGPDIRPQRYGAEPHPQTQPMHPRRECTDFHVIGLAEQRRLPLLAICLGFQEWNVYRGGSLHQHVPDLKRDPLIAHRAGSEFAFHTVKLAEDSLIRSIVETDPLPVNSSHHQCLARPGDGLRPTAWAEDGIIESVEDPTRPFALGIQWHPEDMPDDPLQRMIFQAIVDASC